jgi:hypothetical protein
LVVPAILRVSQDSAACARANDLQALISNNQWQEAQELLYAMSQQVGAMKKLANRLSPSSLAHEIVSHIDI